MFRPRVIPVLQLKGKGLVKTIKYKNPRYIGDPINAVRIFNDLETDELVFLDITATREKRTISVDLVRQIGDEAYMPFAVGGGIHSVGAAVDLINAGAEKIVINTVFWEKPEVVALIAKTLGNQSVVVSLDINKTWLGKYRLFVKSGTVNTNLDPVMAARKAVEYGAGEVILNYIGNDGLMVGYNLELIEQVSQSINIPVIASCGAGKLFHMKQAISSGAHAVAAGSMFVYHGNRNGILINYPEREELISTLYS
jgi:imidazole glycerol-phosphate synthase subunit HisF